MAEIVLFHHAGGLTGGVIELADALREVGHTVHTPDLFAGAHFPNPVDGVAWAESLGEAELAARARAFVDTLNTAELVYGGLGIGSARAAEQVLLRPGALAAFFLYACVDPGYWHKRWPADVPAQAHLCEDDAWRDPATEEGFIARIPGSELFTYPGNSHLYAEPGQPDYDAEVTRIVTSSVIDYLAEL